MKWKMMSPFNLFKKKGKRCDLGCGNILPENPFQIILTDGDFNHEPFKVCEECAKLIEVIGNKMAEHLDDESL